MLLRLSVFVRPYLRIVFDTSHVGPDWDGNAAELLYTITADDGQTAGPPEGFVLVEAGTTPGGYVTIEENYCIGVYEATNEQMREVMQWAYDQGGLINASSSTVQNAQGNQQELLDLDDTESAAFSHWIATAGIAIEAPDWADTRVTAMSGDGTVTAVFVDLEPVAIASSTPAG